MKFRSEKSSFNNLPELISMHIVVKSLDFTTALIKNGYLYNTRAGGISIYECDPDDSVKIAPFRVLTSPGSARAKR